MTYSSTVLADSPIDYWQFSETSGTSAADSGSGAHVATHSTGVTVGVAGGVAGGLCASYNGTGTATAAAGVADFMALTTFSVECWVKYSVNNTDYPTFVRRDGNGKTFLVRTRNVSQSRGNIIEAYLNGQTVDTGTTTFNDGNWHHVVVTYASATLNLYVDGVSYSNRNGTVSVGGSGTTFPVQIGTGTGSTETFNGSLDEVALYSTALSSTRITAHYNAAQPVNITATPPVINVSSGLTTVAPAFAGPIVSKTVTPPAMTLSLDMATAPTISVSTGVVENVTADTDQATNNIHGTVQQFLTLSNLGGASNSAFFLFPTTVGNGQQITGKGKFTFTTSGSQAAGNTYEVRRLTSAFSETDATTQTPTSVATSHTGTFVLGTNQIAIDDAVAAWQGGATNYGIALHVTNLTGSNANQFSVCSRENTTSSNRPFATLDTIPVVLSVTVTPPAMTLDLTTVAPVVSGVSNITDTFLSFLLAPGHRNPGCLCQWKQDCFGSC
jgi:hypothetical protein